MKSIAFVIPYFVEKNNKLPNYFKLWLKTCSYNSSIDFLFFTNDKSHYEFPKNVKVTYCDFVDIVKLCQKQFDFKIELTKPYKLCDFRPAYGEIFHEYLTGYDFWGYCDIDLLWGDIRNFITDDILIKYDKIYTHGHCSLFRNTCEVNSWYRTLNNNGWQNWRDVFISKDACCFDEWGGHHGGGISYILKTNGISQYDNIDMADINVKHGRFDLIRIPGKDWSFKYNLGNLEAFNNKFRCKLLYCHFQKRMIKFENDNVKDEFYLLSPGYVSNKYKKYYIGRMNYRLKFLFNRLKYLVNKFFHL